MGDTFSDFQINHYSKRSLPKWICGVTNSWRSVMLRNINTLRSAMTILRIFVDILFKLVYSATLFWWIILTELYALQLVDKKGFFFLFSPLPYFYLFKFFFFLVVRFNFHVSVFFSVFKYILYSPPCFFFTFLMS